MKTPNTDRWARELQTTEAPQIQAALAQFTGNDLGYCCLGYGCKVADIEWKSPSHDNSIRFDGALSLPPASFLAWLGFTPEEIKGADPTNGEVDADPEYTVYIDWDPELRTPDYGLLTGFFYASEDSSLNSAHLLNDSCGFTFAQIGDIIRHFGVKL